MTRTEMETMFRPQQGVTAEGLDGWVRKDHRQALMFRPAAKEYLLSTEVPHVGELVAYPPPAEAVWQKLKE